MLPWAMLTRLAVVMLAVVRRVTRLARRNLFRGRLVDSRLSRPKATGATLQTNLASLPRDWP